MGQVNELKDFTRGQIDAVLMKIGQDVGMSTAEGVRAFLAGKLIVTKVTEVVKEKVFDHVSPSLHLFTPEPLTLTPTDGSQTIAKAGKFFTGYLDLNFKKWGTNVSSHSTKETKVEVHELIKDGNFAEIYGSLSTNLDNLCLTQPQIIQFVEKHKQWLLADGYGTFFLFKANGEFFVACVGVGSDGGLLVVVLRFDFDSVWCAGCRRRFVLPQLVA
jgi:hypothetical protein